MFGIIFKIRAAIVISVIGWLLFAASSSLVVFVHLNHLPYEFPLHLPKFFYVIFFLSIYVFFRLRIRRNEHLNLTDLLWKVFASGLVATAISMLMQLLRNSMSENKFVNTDYFDSIIFDINSGLLTAFIISTFVVWERLIFYQKTKMLIYSWRVFVYFMLGTLAITFFDLDIIGQRFQYAIGIIIIISIYYSFNLKWVAYLNSREKLRSILLILLTVAYLGYFIYIFLPYYNKQFLNIYVSDVTLLIMFGFVITYGFIALLVLLFNLPTSPVFEQKLEEIVNFQKLSQSYSTGRNINEIHEILLDSSVSAVQADAAWLEISHSGIPEKKCLTYQIDSFRIQEIKTKIRKSRSYRTMGAELIRNIKPEGFFTSSRNYRFRSILLFPITVQNDQVGTLALLKEIPDGFNQEMIGVIRTFVNQASISIENYRLFDSVLENERYVKELNIARTVQKNLLPGSLGESNLFDITAYSKTADEVGGDYFDILHKDNSVVIIIADVSSKGTSAVFYMSQMKGIFQSLAQINLDSKEFLTLANNALSMGLDKASFITVSLFVIDGSSRAIDYSRAGHCPVLFYSKKANSADFLYGEGVGLGIMRNQEFRSHVNIHRIEFETGDILLMFTDGLVEAKNANRDEFGYEKLKNLLLLTADRELEMIKNVIIEELYRFCNMKNPEDDYSMVILKFK